jgi:hypothetical protein
MSGQHSWWNEVMRQGVRVGHADVSQLLRVHASMLLSMLLLLLLHAWEPLVGDRQQL